jgi:hypothetical protein
MREYIRIWKPFLPRELKATRELSGEVGDGVLVGAVVVHLPDFLAAAAAFDVEDFGFGDAGGATAEAEDDFVGEAVGDLAGAVLCGFLVVLLGEDLGVLGVLGVVEEAVDDDAVVLHAEAAECDHGGARGSGGPLGEIDFGLRAGSGLGREAFGDDVEDAGAGEVGEEGGVEGVLEGGGVAGGALEVGGGETDARGAGAGLEVEGILCAESGCGENGEQGQEEECVRGLCLNASCR